MGDGVPYLPTHFITESVPTYRNTTIGKQPTQWGTVSLTYQLTSSLKVSQPIVILPLVSNPRSGGGGGVGSKGRRPLRGLFTQGALPCPPLIKGDGVPYLPTHFITESVPTYRNTTIGKQPTQWGGWGGLEVRDAGHCVAYLLKELLR